MRLFEQRKPKASRHLPGKTAMVLAVLLLAYAFLFGPAAAEERPVKLMIVSDLHYLAPSLYEESDGSFEKALKRGDGKMSHCSRELLEGLVLEARHRRPDALIVSGDLSFNGERESHRELAAAFETLRAEGIAVWIIPGNHDIQYPFAAKYTTGGYEILPPVTPEEFREIYAAFMSASPDSRDPVSYTVTLTDRWRLAMCDAGVYEPVPASGGLYTGETDAWLQEVLEQAKADRMQVITVTHQSLIPHTAFRMDAMTIENGTLMAQRMRRSGTARLNLSGHLHIQHISEEEGIFDIATGAFSVPPFRYGLLTLREDGSLAYEAAALCREHLPPAAAGQADTWFEEIVKEKEAPALEALETDPEARERMLDYAARLNHAYFSGDFVSVDPQWTEDPARGMWMKIREQDAFAAYLLTLPGSPENARSALRLDLPGPAADR